MKRADARAAASVTRATSSARLRSIRRSRSRQVLLDPETDRPALDGLEPANARERRLDVALVRIVGLDHDRNDGGGAALFLNDGCDTNPMTTEDASDVREDAGSIATHDPHVV